VKAVSAGEMRDIEAEVVRRGTPLDELMARAGRALATSVESHPRGEVLVLCGPGNNGNDGLIAASHLLRSGRGVTAYGFRRTDWHGFTGPGVSAEEDEELRRLDLALRRAAVVVDALLGIGAARPPSGLLAAIIERANQIPSGAWKLAVDIPTGVDADSGSVAGPAFKAAHTLCMGFLKRGVALFPGAEYAGTVEVADLGFPGDLAEGVTVSVPSPADVAALLPRRGANTNKGSYGRVLFIGGSRDFAGAPALAAEAAYRAGAGLVEVAVPAIVQPMVAAHLREAIFRPLADHSGQIGEDSLPALRAALAHALSVVLGPGMGLGDETLSVVEGVLDGMLGGDLRGAVVDADALNALARSDGWWQRSLPLVLTPHPGEMGRLTGMSVAAIQSDRLDVARRYSTLWQKIVVLKGAGTIVASPDGRATINPTGGPNLATAGTGDVLSGLIAGLLAQGTDPFDAAVAGVFLHGQAGDLAAADIGPVGTLASDLLPRIPRARHTVAENSEVKK